MADDTSSGSSSLKRYGPIAVVAVAVIAAIVVFGGGDDGGDDDNTETTDSSENASGLPLTFQEAEEQGRDDIDWGEGCDTDRGRVAIPIRNAAPCVEPFEEGADNGGATSPGVTADSIKVIVYQGEPDIVQQALVGAAGADTDPSDTANAAVDYLEMLDDVYETYGRSLDIEIFEATGLPSDTTAAAADALSIIDKEPFALVGGPAEVNAYW